MATSTDLVPLRELREALSTIEEKVVTGYTLADAIREAGASSSSQQTRGTWVRPNGDSCALGAGWLAAMARGYIPSS